MAPAEDPNDVAEGAMRPAEAARSAADAGVAAPQQVDPVPIGDPDDDGCVEEDDDEEEDEDDEEPLQCAGPVAGAQQDAGGRQAADRRSIR